jgi:hypothetical protein
MHFRESIPKTEDLVREFADALNPAGRSAFNKRSGQRPTGQRSFEAIPGVPAVEASKPVRQFEEFLVRTKDRLTEEVPVGVNHIIEENESGADFEFLLSTPAVPMDPMGHPPARDYDPKVLPHPLQKQIAEEMISQFFSHVVAKPYHHLQIGTTSIPLWSRSREVKVATINNVFALNKDKDRQRAIIEGDYASLAADGFFFASFIQRRETSEGPKPRKAHTTRTILEGIEPIIANKDIPGTRLMARRSRAVYAYSASTNWVPMYVLYQFLHGYMESFPNTYKAIRQTDLNQEAIFWEDIVATDFSNFDFGVPRWFFDLFLEGAAKVMPEWMVACMRRLLHAGIYSPAIYRDGTDAAMFGSPFELNSEFEYGLGSGIVLNVPIGRIFGTLLQLSIGHSAGIWNMRNWVSILRGEGDAGIKSVTDDGLFYGSQLKMTRLRNFLKKPTSDMFLGTVEEEVPARFLGMNPYRIDGGRIRFGRRPEGILNSLQPERSQALSQRPYAGVGALARLQEYLGSGMHAPLSSAAAGSIWSIASSTFAGVYGQSMEGLIEAAAARAPNPTIDLDGRLIDEPERINFDARYADIDPNVLAELVPGTVTVSADTIFEQYPFLTQYL